MTLSPTCRSITRRLWRRFASEISAQVGRVAVRFNISIVATSADYSGESCNTQVTPVLLLYASDPPKVLFFLTARQHEVHRDLRLHLHRLSVERVRPVAPLLHRINRSLHQHGMSAEDLQIFNHAVPAYSRT